MALKRFWGLLAGDARATLAGGGPGCRRRVGRWRGCNQYGLGAAGESSGRSGREFGASGADEAGVGALSSSPGVNGCIPRMIAGVRKAVGRAGGPLGSSRVLDSSVRAGLAGGRALAGVSPAPRRSVRRGRSERPARPVRAKRRTSMCRTRPICTHFLPYYARLVPPSRQRVPSAAIPLPSSRPPKPAFHQVSQFLTRAATFATRPGYDLGAIGSRRGTQPGWGAFVG